MMTRILVGAALVALFALILIFGGYLSFAAATIATLLSVYEMCAALRKAGYDPFAWGAYGCAALMYTAYLLYGAAGLGACYALGLMLTMGVWLVDGKRTAQDMICSLFLCIYPLFFYGILISVIAYPDRDVARAAMLLCFVSPLMGDTLAYFIGSAFGRHKLCPAISPKKTIEGSVAGLLGGVLGGAITWWVSSLWTRAALVPLLILGLVCGALGQVGDLFASRVKRWAGIKDYGNILPGHGGVLDRLDSVLFCGPVALIYIALLLRA